MKASSQIRIIAEIGSVHDGSFGNALKLIKSAAQCGADAVKFQTHIAEAETLPDAPSPAYFTAEPRFDYFRRTAFSPERWAQLRSACERAGVTFLSSPFSIEAIDLLEKVGVAAYKFRPARSAIFPCWRRLSQPRSRCCCLRA